MFSDLAKKILEKRYYLRDKNNNLLENSPEEIFTRVATYIAEAEINYGEDPKMFAEESFNAMMKQEMIPASPVLFNAGTSVPALSSCFALMPEDNMESILNVFVDSTMIFKFGGGVGWNFSNLRAKDSLLSSGGSSSGVCSFITLFDIMIETIKQGGKRRGAGAAILDADHTDILEFIQAKRDNIWNNINISVICTNSFMSEIDGKNKDVWKELVQSNWECGDPNIIFIDTINKFNPLPLRPINCVNPCHEICMPSGESCNLVGVNLDKCLKGHKGNIKINWDKLGKLVKLSHRFADNMIDMCQYPTKEIDKWSKRTRRQGVYVFGLAPFLIKLGVRYGSQESFDLVDNLFCYINRVSLESCIRLGQERGNFPEFENSIYVKKYKHMRCSQRLTIAPSGTTSRIADSYFAIEPYYAFDYVSNIMDEKIEGHFSVIDEYKDLYPEALVTAHGISPEEHIRMISIIGRWIDQSISKTVNLPFETTEETVSQLFKLSYSLGLKSISIFRDKCKESQVLEKTIKGSGRRGSYTKFEISRKLLRDLYNNKGFSQSQIAKLLGVSRNVVVLRMKEYEIEPRSEGGRCRYVYTPDVETVKLLHNKGLNLDEIAAVFDHEKTFIQGILEEADVRVGNSLERSIPLTPLLIELIEGELLGDGCIMPVGGSPKTKMAYYTHSSKYKEYVEWLNSIFSSEGLLMGGNIRKDEDVDHLGVIVYRFHTISCVELMNLRKKWYDKEGKKHVPHSLKLTPIMVRQWFIGDGGRKSDGAMYFCTEAFDKKSMDIIERELKRIGIPEITITKRNEVYIKKGYTSILLDYMEKSFYIDAPKYEYKFVEKYEGKPTEPIQCKSGVCDI